MIFMMKRSTMRALLSRGGPAALVLTVFSICAHADVCRVPTQFVSYRTDDIAFDIPADSFSSDRGEYRHFQFPEGCYDVSLETRPQTRPATAGGGAESVDHLLEYLVPSFTSALTDVFPWPTTPHGAGEIHFRPRALKPCLREPLCEGIAILWWIAPDRESGDHVTRHIEFETKRHQYTMRVSARRGSEAVLQAGVEHLLDSLTVNQQASADISAAQTAVARPGNEATMASTWKHMLESLNGNDQTPGAISAAQRAVPLPEVSSQQAGTSRCPAAGLIGNWSGEPMSSLSQVISVSLQFKPDGTYSYTAGQGNAVWITHSGRYQIADGPDTRWSCSVSLVPDPATISVASKALLLVLQSRDLIDNQTRTFLYKFFPTSTRLMMAGTWTDWKNDIGSFGLNRR
jgi:hypothetical protein